MRIFFIILVYPIVFLFSWFLIPVYTALVLMALRKKITKELDNTPKIEKKEAETQC